MSLFVKLHRFKVIKCKAEQYARFEFRGAHKFTPILQREDDYLVANKRLEWVITHPIGPGEVLTLHLMSRGRWNSHNIIGVYRLGLQIVVQDRYLLVTDSLLDDHNKPVMAYVEMEVRYRPPPIPKLLDSHEDILYESDANNQPPAPSAVHTAANSQAGSKQTSPRGSIHSSAQSDGENILLDVERNIASLERSIQNKETVIEIESGEETRAGKLKSAGKLFLKRGFSFGAEKSSPVPDQEVRISKRSTLKSVRSFMKLGRSKNRYSSGDEEQGLLDTACGGPLSDADHAISQASFSSDELLVDTRSPSDTPKKTMASALDNIGTTILKPVDIQVCVTIIEARQLAGLNMDPVVCVQIGNQRRFTQVKESTNCPYYNEYFVFDFKMPTVMLFDKMITLSVMQSRHLLRANKLLGTFKLDVGTVFNQPNRQFYHRWATLIDPDDVTAGAKGFLKCDISIIGKGDTVKIPPKSEKDEDDIEANLLLPDGVPIERQRAHFTIKIHKADGLPKMNYSIVANVKRAITGETHDLVDSYVEVCFAGAIGFTSVRKNCYSPEWNEQIVFTEMFPPLCQRIKIQLRDSFSVQPNIVGTHFIDLTKISHDGEKGFLPTFGPAYINLYGSTRDYNYSNSKNTLNEGMGEGVGYRGRILVSIRTEILEGVEYPISSEVETEPIPPITESSFHKNEEFFLFGSIFEANMVDKRLVDKPMSFEMSLGNSGNNLDGHSEPLKKFTNLAVENLDELQVDTGYWRSTTVPSKAISTDKNNYYLPIWEDKQTMQIRSVWPDYRRRMFNSNMIANIIEKFENGLAAAQAAIEAESGVVNSSIQALKSTLEITSNACAAYVQRMTNAPPMGKTPLDRERQKLCLDDIDQICTLTKNLRALITKHSIKDRLRTAYTYLGKLKHICEDPQHAMPDVFIWMISNGKRLAYYRVPARDIIFSEHPDESGRICGKLQTVFLKWPGKKSCNPSGWAIPVKISIYLWLGVISEKIHYIDGLPEGYALTSELKNAGYQQTNAPQNIHYTEKHTFQMRAYMYQARSLIGSDSSGLSDPFARVIIGDSSATTKVIDQTLSPTWDELLVFDDVLLYSTIEQIKTDPPTIIIEIFDQDSVGKSEFIGRTLARPYIKSIADLKNKPQYPPSLEWYEIRRGEYKAGELLATFELLEVLNKNDTTGLPALPNPREVAVIAPNGTTIKGPILPVPRGIRPTLSKYRIEVLFWGLRDVKRIHLLTVDKPLVDIECAGNILQSSRINNTKQNPNFSNPVKFIDVDLPEQDLYQPPLTIRVQDHRSFGRLVLVGTHTINSVHKYMYSPMSKRDREIEDRKKSLIQLQNVDLRTNTIIQDDFEVDNELESCPLLLPQRCGISYGSGKQSTSKKTQKSYGSRKRKQSTESAMGEADGSRDWWTKYFSSVEVMIEEEKEAKHQRQGLQPSRIDEGRSPRDASPRSEPGQECGGGAKRRPGPPKVIKVQPTSTQAANATASTKTAQIPKTALTKVYPHELEAVPEYDEFKEWLHSFLLLRGKKTGAEDDDDNRIVGIFKGAIKIYKWPLPRGIEDHTVMGFDPSAGFFQGVPNNDPIHVLVRVYIVKATDLHPMDFNGKADPYIVLHLGSKKINDKENYVSKQLNPVFGKCFEIEATFPQDSMLTIQVLDWDLVGSDDLIGETKIDLENRFYSRHRATCGLPIKYEETGYNRWRDAMKPTQILAKLCKDGKLDPPVYEQARVKVGRTIFNMQMDDTELFSNPDTTDEQMALNVLRRWQEVPRVGTRLVTEHVETRPLYNPNKPGIEQGRLEMWVDMFPMDMPAPGPPLDISPRKPKSYEMRVIIWNTDDVVLEDDAFFTGEKMSDIYVKGWLKGPEDCQSTDIHYRSLTGEGNFNWRFIYPFNYMEAEERIVISRKESMFSWDETECKIPARLELQVWDADHFSADDFLGAITLDLNRFPRGAKSAKLCTLQMLRNDGSVPMVNIFKQKRVKGWWPFYIKRDTEEMELTGKVEAEIHLLTRDEADKVPAGLGRSEPDPLEKPNRPDASFMWFLNPLKSIRYIVWHNHKWTIIRLAVFFTVALAIFLLVYAVPGYTVKRLLGA